MSSPVETIAVIGGGAWGTALATVARRAGRNVMLWAREPEVVEAINTEHRNSLFLPDILLDSDIRADTDLGIVRGADAVLLVSPAQATRAVSSQLAEHLPDGCPVVICAKGIEQETGRFLSDVLSETLPGARAMVLSGPSFASDVAQGLPTAVTLAGASENLTRAVADAIAIPSFRPYLSGDVVGAQVGGSVKNVLAIACGIVEGKGFGASARAALTARGFAELQRFGTALGARPETLAGLSGLGDLVLTCNSVQSRNMSLGLALGRGRSIDEVLGSRNSVSEGVHTADIVVKVAEGLGVEMPISAAVQAIVSGRAGVDDTIENLLNRPIRAES